MLEGYLVLFEGHLVLLEGHLVLLEGNCVLYSSWRGLCINTSRCS